MLRWIKRILIVGVCIFALALYREWVIFHEPKLFLPLGFIESSAALTTPEEDARDPRLWEEPLAPIVVSEEEFDGQARALGAATQSGADVLVIGSSLGGAAAALAAAEDGASAVLVSPEASADDAWSMDSALLLREMNDAGSESDLEERLRGWLRRRYRATQRDMIGTPADVTEFLRGRLSAGGVRMEEGFSPVAFTGPSATELNRVLLRNADGSLALVIPFTVLLDGTAGGDVYPLVGAAYDTGWDARESTGERFALPKNATLALAEGYTHSGFTVPGIGRRLDGGEDAVAVVDMGYHGTLVRPSSFDASCWKNSAPEAKPFSVGGVVLRANRADCPMTFDVRSDFEDIVDVFVIQQGNDSVNALVETGDRRIPLSLKFHVDPTERFAYVGAFPLGADDPLTITLRSTLPTDRIEGIVVRKRNALFAPHATVADPVTRTAIVDARGWKSMDAEAYVALGEDVGTAELVVDGTRFTLENVGNRTWKTALPGLTEGQHVVTVDGAANVTGVVVIPLEPFRTTVATFSTGTATGASSYFLPLPSIDPVEWRTSVENNGQYLLTTTVPTCGSLCGISVTESGSIALAGKNVVSNIDTVAPSLVALNVVELRAGVPYVVSFSSADPRAVSGAVRLLRLDEANADLFAEQAGVVSLRPEHDGLYDVWIRTSQSASVSVDTTGTPVTIRLEPGVLTFVGTKHLSPGWGLNVVGGGRITVLAVPNTTVDTFRHRFAPGDDGETTSLDVPSGRMSAWWEGEAAPAYSSFRDARGTTQQLTFDGADRASAEPLFADGAGPLSVDFPPLAAPADLVLHDPLSEGVSATATRGSLQELVPFRDATAVLPQGFAPLAEGSGVLLLRVRPEGVGPVTLGLLRTTTIARRLKDQAAKSYALLRTMSHAGCGDTPDCDPRRYVLAPFAFGTPDGHARTPLYPDGRRLKTLSTLSASGAYLLETVCRASCESACLLPPGPDGRCIAREQRTSVGENVVLSVDGSATLPAITSPLEEIEGTLPGVLRALRTDGLLGLADTYLERALPARPVELTIGMFAEQDGRMLLPANTTLGSTHLASRALRSARARIAIGAAAGHIAVFAAQTHASPSSIAADPTLLRSLRVYLLEKGTRVFPVEDMQGDPILMRAVQRIILEGRGSLIPVWKRSTLHYTVDVLASHTPPRQVIADLIGADAPPTVRSLMRVLAPEATSDAALLSKAVSLGLLPPAVLQLSVSEIMDFAIDTSLVLKTNELLQYPEHR